MRRNWWYASAIGLLLWLPARMALGAAGVPDSVPVNVVNPLIGWESQIKDFGSLAIVVLVVRWFMVHVETLNTSHLEILRSKDEQYTKLAQSCREENMKLTQLVMEMLHRIT